MLADVSRSILLVVDVQPVFLKAIQGADQVLRRSEFLVRIATMLDVPVIATEQNAKRMGATDPALLRHLPSPPVGKMTFSCIGCRPFDEALQDSKREQVIIVGIETHICVTQTAIHLMQQGLDVTVCEDAVSARAQEMNDIGFRRLRHAGIDVAHTESIAYEWLGSADNPKFREALQIVKEFAVEPAAAGA